ncbi:hypothetical protein H5410_061122 [Solanum commersonii]|uniref:Uncharacterized protein n=1 Tax=Solanum commersonii TaxID=4109 RepID=A0A9J5W804_SOLCO|nr:hypothetical protein H5410_061122 [Solanum commersonii]
MNFPVISHPSHTPNISDHSAQLVGITNTLGDPPFGRFHRLFALAFSIFALRVVERYSTASRNYSATRRLLHFIANLIFPIRAQHTGTKGDLQVDRRLAKWARRSSSLYFFIFSAALFLLTK